MHEATPRGTLDPTTSRGKFTWPHVDLFSRHCSIAHIFASLDMGAFARSWTGGVRTFATARVNFAQLRAALLVTRAPVLQKPEDNFEREYYRFNVALAHRLQQPFPRDMYFKKGSAAEQRFDEYYAQLQNTWHVATETRARSVPGKTGKRADTDAELYATMPRTTEADERGDQGSIERALDRTLYLVVAPKGKGPAAWRLPAKALPEQRTPSVTLHDNAIAAVTESFGEVMDLWLVSRLPIAVVPEADDKVCG